MRDQELIGLYEAYKEVHRPTETTEELEYDTQSSYQDWVNQLVEEGYDLSNWTDEGLYELYYNEERAPGVKEYPGGGYSLRKEVRKSDAVKPAGKRPKGDTSGYGQVRPDGKDPLNTPAKDERNFANALAPKPKAFPRIFGILDPDNTRNRQITDKMGKPKPKAPVRRTINADFEMWVDGLLNEGYDLSNWTSMGLYEYYEQLCEESVEIGQSPTPGGITTKRTPSSTVINRTPRDRKLTPIESYKESYDIILSHLLDEGYADTVENAESIMVNMSEEWRQSIFEGMFDFLPQGKTVIQKPEDKRNLLQKYSDATNPLFAGLPRGKFAGLPQGKTVIQKPEDKRNLLQKYSDATKPLFAGLPQAKFAGLPQGKTGIQKPQPRGREFTNPPS